MTVDVVVSLAKRPHADAVGAVLFQAFEPLRDCYTPAAFDATVPDAARIEQRLTEGPIWIASIDTEVVGTVSIRDDDRGLYLRGMAVVPSVRRSGVGEALLETALSYRADQAVWLYTTGFLHDATRMYERFGFRIIDEEPAPSLFGVPLVRMELARDSS